MRFKDLAVGKYVTLNRWLSKYYNLYCETLEIVSVPDTKEDGDDLANLTHFLGSGKVRTDLPYNLTGFLVGNCHDVRFTSVPNDVVRMETFIAIVIPFVWPEGAHGVNVHPVTEFTIFGEVLVRVTEENVLRSLGEAQFTEVFAYTPFPNNVTFPVNFYEYVIEELLVGNLVVMNGFMAQDRKSVV